MASPPPQAPQGGIVALGIPDSQDYPRLVFAAPYFEQVPLAELIEPAVIEAIEAALPALVPPYVDAAAEAAVASTAVLLTGSTMTGPLMLNPSVPTAPSMAASMSYVDMMVATAGVPEVPPVPSGQLWARQTGQWAPIAPQTGVFLPLAGGAMTGNINMSGNTVSNMAAVPAMPNGAAPAQWVLNQIAAVSLYQGTWNADTNVPDLTSLALHVNGYTWFALTAAPSGVVISQPIPGLQGLTIYNGDTVIYSTVQGKFASIHAGGITLPEADGRYVQLAGSQMSGALLLNSNATAPLQAVTLQQLNAAVTSAGIGEAPSDGQVYARNGLTHAWTPALPLAGGILTGALTLYNNAGQPLQAVPLQQMTAAITAGTAGLLPLAGGTMTGLLVLSGNASANLNPVPLQQLTSVVGAYLPLTGGTMTGQLVPAHPAGIAGTPTNDNAPAGAVGEYITAANTSGTTIPASTATNITQITLSAGDWDVTGQATLTGNAAGGVAVVAINTVSATLPAVNTLGTLGATVYYPAVTGGSNAGVGLSTARISVAGTTTAYLIGWGNPASSGTGRICARRVR